MLLRTARRLIHRLVGPRSACPLLVVALAVGGPGGLVHSAPGVAQEPVRYEIAFPEAQHHEARVTIRFRDLDPGPLEVRMSRTSPGRYALHEFAKNVYGFQARGVGGRPVEVHRPDLHQWTITGHGGEVEVRYVLYGDRADGTYTGIDRSHAHLNMPATFAWARGLEARPVELTVRAPEGSGWRVATQLAPTSDPYVYTAPDLAYFLDSPTEVSDFWEASWEVPGPDGPQRIRIALHHDGTEEEARRYAEAAQAIVEAEAGVWGEPPAFDHGTYTFLACYLPWVDGDGMEHRNSTVLTSSGSLAERRTGLLGTVAHEFFHAWNVERIRPAALEPFDWEAANVTGALWFGEGFTSYYTNVALWRAGIIDDAAFARRLGGTVDAVVNAPGRAWYSPVGMSMQAPFVDAAVSVDPTNRANTFLSYYTWGSAVGLGLDLTLRTRFPGLTLDHLMREMWRSHGDPERPYTVADVEAALARVTGDPAFAADFFRRFVRGGDVPDYATLLAAAGMDLRLARPGRASLGRAFLREADGGVEVVEATLKGTPLYRAGVDRGDVILSVDGRSVGSPGDLEALLSHRDPGDPVTVRFRSRGEVLEATVELVQDPTFAAALDPDPGAAALRFREGWRAATHGETP